MSTPEFTEKVQYAATQLYLHGACPRACEEMDALRLNEQSAQQYVSQLSDDQREIFTWYFSAKNPHQKRKERS